MNISMGIVVEILLGGIFSVFWMMLLFLKILGFSLDNLIKSIITIVNTSNLGYLLVILFAFAYVNGWVIHFICDVIFDTIFQKKIREKIFKSEENFYIARANVFLYGSEYIIKDIDFDRQLLRTSRQNAFNFLLIAVILLAYIYENKSLILILSITSLLISILSFLQWRSKYISSYNKIYRAYKTLNKEGLHNNKTNPSLAKLSDLPYSSFDNTSPSVIEQSLTKQNKTKSDLTQIKNKPVKNKKQPDKTFKGSL